MENKILINVVVPILEENYNVFVPVGKTVDNVKEQLQNSISELSMGAVDKNHPMDLYDSNGTLLQGNLYIKETNIENGCKVILI